MQDIPSDITPDKLSQLTAALEKCQEVYSLAAQWKHKYSRWAELWIEEADGIKRSFEYFIQCLLSGGVVNSGYRFWHWFPMPEKLIKQINKTIALFERLEAEENYGD